MSSPSPVSANTGSINSTDPVTLNGKSAPGKPMQEATITMPGGDGASVLQGGATAGTDSRQPGERKEFHQKLFKTPKETTSALLQASQNKADLSLTKLAVLSFASGVFISFGGAFAIIVGKGIPTLPIGIQHLLFGACFAVGLIFIVLFGGELFTGNCMIMTLGLIGKAITWKKFTVSLVGSFVFNFLGCAFGAAFLVYWSEMFNVEPYLTAVKVIAEVKCALPPHVAFLRGISANWLVNIAMFTAAAAESIEGKILACFIPIATFAAISYEHSVANMFFVPLGLMYGAQSDFGTFIYRNLILVTLGNYIGGAIGVGAIAWFVYIYRMQIAPFKKSLEDGKFKFV